MLLPQTATRESRSATLPMILMYHSVEEYTEDPYRMTVSPIRFEAQMRELSRQGLRGVTVRELLSAWRAGDASGLVGLSFDDGYADFLTGALPALQRYGFAATLFVLANQLGGENVWDPEGPRKPLMTADQVRLAAAEGMEIGSHGLSHTSLPSIHGAAVTVQVQQSRSRLRDLVGQEISGLAYPYGHVGTREIDAARAAGYDYACAVWDSGRKDVHALPRTYMGERDGGLRLFAKRVRHSVRW